jgi:hypothetical protein
MRFYRSNAAVVNLSAEGAIPQDKRLAFGPRTIWFALQWIQIKGAVVEELGFLAINPPSHQEADAMSVILVQCRGRITGHSDTATAVNCCTFSRRPRIDPGVHAFSDKAVKL